MTADENAIKEAERVGFDLNLIDLNLSLSPQERCRQHDMALAVIQELQKARRRHDARLQPTPATAR